MEIWKCENWSEPGDSNPRLGSGPACAQNAVTARAHTVAIERTPKT